jgi:ABC-type branched-subunit amino acid transport system ATPase component
MSKILQLKNISKIIKGSYLNDRKESDAVDILKNINLVLEEGKIYSIVGGNGAGKSSLLNVIQNYASKDEGELTFYQDNIPVDITNFPSAKLSKFGIGRLFQNLLVFENLSLLDNMYLGCLEDSYHNPLCSLVFRKQIKRIEESNRV